MKFWLNTSSCNLLAPSTSPVFFRALKVAAYWQMVFKDLTCCRTRCSQWFRSWATCKQDALSRKRINFSIHYFHGNCRLDWSYLEGKASCWADRNSWMLQQPERMCFLNVCWLVDWCHVQATPTSKLTQDQNGWAQQWKNLEEIQPCQAASAWTNLMEPIFKCTQWKPSPPW